MTPLEITTLRTNLPCLADEDCVNNRQHVARHIFWAAAVVAAAAAAASLAFMVKAAVLLTSVLRGVEHSFTNVCHRTGSV
jgi:hypothetical protein